MITYITLLRGINIGKHRRIQMSELIAMYSEMGFVDVRTYIQSGNVVFGSNETDKQKLGTVITDKIKERFGHDVPVITLSANELKEIIKNNPFDNIGFLTLISEVPDISKLTELNSQADIHLWNNVIYITEVENYAKYKYSNAYIEKSLKVFATTRNWKTIIEIMKLAEK